MTEVLNDEFKKAKAELEREVRSKEVEWQTERTGHAHREKEWIEKVNEKNKEIKKAKDKLKGVDEWVADAKELGLPVLPEKVEAKKAKIEKEIKGLEKERNEIGGQAEQELRKSLEALQPIEAACEEAKRRLEGLKAYEEELKS